MTPMIIQETILKRNQQWLQDKVEKINRKAKKLGVHPFNILFENEHLCTDDDNKRFDRGAILIDVSIVGEIPKIENWELVSIFERESDVILTRTVPGVDELPYYPKEIKCEHCGHNRYRKKSYLLKHIHTGEFKEIGSTCVRDFIGHDPKAFIWHAQYDWTGLFEEASDPETKIGYYAANYGEPLIPFLALTKACINIHGWVSKGKANDNNENAEREEDMITATVTHVIHQYAKAKHPSSYMWLEKVDPSEEDVEFAKEAIKHFEELTEINDYVNNIKNVIHLGYAPDNKYGLCASIVGSYYMKLQREIERKAKEKITKTSEWQGELKERREWNLTYLYTTEFENQWGLQSIHNFKDEDDNLFKWFTGNALTYGPINELKVAFENDRVILVGTVKKHDEYRGKKSTILTRCKVKDIIPSNESNN